MNKSIALDAGDTSDNISVPTTPIKLERRRATKGSSANTEKSNFKGKKGSTDTTPTPASANFSATYNEQANYLEAILHSFSPEPRWNGIYCRKWDKQNDCPNYNTDPVSDKGFTVLSKPAEERMRELYGEINPAQKDA